MSSDTVAEPSLSTPLSSFLVFSVSAVAVAAGALVLYVRVLAVDFEQNMTVLVAGALGAALLLTMAGTQTDANIRRELWAARRTSEFASKAAIKATTSRAEKRAVQQKARRAAVCVFAPFLGA